MMMMMMMKKEKQTTLWSRLRPCFELEFTIDGIYRLCHKEENSIFGNESEAMLDICIRISGSKNERQSGDDLITVDAMRNVETFRELDSRSNCSLLIFI